MVKTFLIGVSALAWATVAAAPAAATIMTATFTGTIVNGWDGSGFFGPEYESLVGSAFVAASTYDTGLGTRDSEPGQYDVIYASGLPSLGSTSITINGISKTISGDSSSGIELRSNITYYAFASSPLTVFEAIFVVAGGRLTSLNRNFSTNEITSFEGYSNHGSVHYDFTSFEFKLDSFSITGGRDGVPEPASWALLITGFALTGLAMRRRTGAAMA